MRIIIVAIAALALAGCTRERTDAGYYAVNAWALTSANPTGPVVSCIEQSRIRNHIARDDRTIDFQLTDGTIMRNRLPYGCPGLRLNNRVAYRTALSRLCSVDLVRLIEPSGAPGPSCGLGEFQPISIPPRPPALQRRP